MKMGLSKFFLPVLAVSMVGFVVHATAQDANSSAPMPGTMPASSMNMMHTSGVGSMVNMTGMHTMPATVTAADAKTGVVDVMSEGMALQVHFPPAAMANLKAGDKIELYMGYRNAGGGK